MRREMRTRKRKNKVLYTTVGFIVFLIIMFAVLYYSYNKKLENISKSMLSTEDIIGLAPESFNEANNTEQASLEFSKTINETINSLNETNEVIEENTINEVQTSSLPKEEVKVEEKKKELSFAYPVQGDILREFSTENLMFSETLQEWTVHQGVDIKADRTTVVKAAEEGKIIAIKNDPRYGLTIIVEHDNNYKTIYSNLLTTEFVTEKEEVEKGQSLGTVGNSAIFEIADEPHLHFEMIKDGEYINPLLNIK